MPQISTAKPANDPLFQRARQQANDVLAQREFQSAQPTRSWWQRLVAKFWSLLDRFFSGAANYSARRPWIGTLVGWGTIVLGLGGLTAWIVRTFRREGMALRFASGDKPLFSPLHDTDWSTLAQTCADRGQWRDAIHAQYWAVIVMAERCGLWRPNPTRTPREYLSLIVAGPQRESLRHLTRLLERLWYGNSPASNADWHSAQSLARAFTASLPGLPR